MSEFGINTESEKVYLKENGSVGSNQGDIPTQNSIASFGGVPETPNMCSVLKNMKYDCFTVTPAELMRKACDEMTRGLHWYTLYTMIHSQIYKKDPTYFQITKGKTELLNFNTLTFEGASKDEQLSINMKTLKTIKRDMESFERSTATKDIRYLLRHVEAMLIASPSGEYYGMESSKHAKVSRDCVRYFCHSNKYSPAGLHLSVNESSYDIIAHREMERVRLGMNSFENLIHSIVSASPRTDKIQRKDSNELNTFVNVGCEELRNAAFEKFKTVHSIKKIFTYLYSKERRQSNLFMEDCAVREILENIEIKLKKEMIHNGSIIENRQLSHLAQFSLLNLWAKFGHAGADRQGAAPSALKKGITDENQVHDRQPLHSKTVFRYKFVTPSSEERQQVITADKSFQVDPIGVTNWDILHRALDLTSSALRKTLIHINRVYYQYKREAPDGDTYQKLFCVMGSLLSNEATPLQITESAYEVAQIAPLFEERKKKDKDGKTLKEKEAPAKVFELWKSDNKTTLKSLGLLNKNPSIEDDERMFDLFFKCSPHYTDSRFISEKLRAIHFNRLPVFLNMDVVTKIRDWLYHSVNIHCPDILKSFPSAGRRHPSSTIYLSEEVETLVSVFETDFMQMLGAQEWGEYKALKELHAALPQYVLWRQRQYTAQTDYGSGMQLRQALQGVLTCKAETATAPTADGLLSTCAEALRLNMSLLRVKDHEQREGHFNSNTHTHQKKKGSTNGKCSSMRSAANRAADHEVEYENPFQVLDEDSDDDESVDEDCKEA